MTYIYITHFYLFTLCLYGLYLMSWLSNDNGFNFFVVVVVDKIIEYSSSFDLANTKLINQNQISLAAKMKKSHNFLCKLSRY